MKKVIVALEGLVHAGKSTLLRSIMMQEYKFVKCIEEYVEFATERFPVFPKSREFARSGHMFFLNLEQNRKAEMGDSDRIILLDRSIFSILAYNFAVEKMSNGEIPCFQDSVNAYENEDWLIPEACIYLDVDDENISLRHQNEKGFYHDIFLEKTFNAQLREFYESVMPFYFPSLEIIRIDACKPKQLVMAKMKEFLMRMA